MLYKMRVILNQGILGKLFLVFLTRLTLLNKREELKLSAMFALNFLLVMVHYTACVVVFSGKQERVIALSLL